MVSKRKLVPGTAGASFLSFIVVCGGRVVILPGLGVSASRCRRVPSSARSTADLRCVGYGWSKSFVREPGCRLPKREISIFEFQNPIGHTGNDTNGIETSFETSAPLLKTVHKGQDGNGHLVSKTLVFETASGASHPALRLRVLPNEKEFSRTSPPPIIWVGTTGSPSVMAPTTTPITATRRRRASGDRKEEED